MASEREPVQLTTAAVIHAVRSVTFRSVPCDERRKYETVDTGRNHPRGFLRSLDESFA